MENFWYFGTPSDTYQLTYELQIGPLVAQWGGRFERFERKTERDVWDQYGYGKMIKLPFLGYVVLWIYRQ